MLDLGGGLAVAHTTGEQVPDIATGVTEIVLAVAEAMAARGLPLPELVLEPGPLDRRPDRDHAVLGRCDQAGGERHHLRRR